MKPILAIVLLFGLLSLGTGVYFIQKNQSTQTRIQASQTRKEVILLINDCNYHYLANCAQAKTPAQLQAEVYPAVEKILKSYASPSLLTYTESVDPSIFSQLGLASDFPVQESYSVADIITRVSLSSQVHYKLLLTLLATQGKTVWDGGGSPSNPFGRQELTFAGQLAGVASDLQKEFNTQSESPSAFVTIDQHIYLFDTKIMTIGSRALYTYFAKTMTTEEFEKMISVDPLQEDSFGSVWEKFFKRFATEQ